MRPRIYRGLRDLTSSFLQDMTFTDFLSEMATKMVVNVAKIK